MLGAMRMRVRLKLPNAEEVVVGHGALLGRLPQAAVHLPDPRVSEAHALISLRGQDACLLALRGRFAVEGRPRAEVVLVPGLRIQLARDLEIKVLEVVLPSSVMALEGPFGRRVLMGPTSVFSDPPRLEHGWRPGAAAVVWPMDDTWYVGDDQALAPGDSLGIQGLDVRAVAEPVQRDNQTVQSLDFSQPLRIVVRFDSVHIHREQRPTLRLSGIAARIITELALTGAPVDWQEIARLCLPASKLTPLRQRWDMHLVRLRGKLRKAGVRTDLIRADGTGLIELVLSEQDRLVDES